MKRVRALQGPVEMALQHVDKEMREKERIEFVKEEQSVEEQSQS